MPLRKLELGCGHRPTEGYIHNDVNAFEGVDIVANPWEIDLPDNYLEEVIALGLMEHLTNQQVEKTLCNMHRILQPGAPFLFDVPDIPVWCRYVADYFDGKAIPFSIDHCMNTLYGWQRWPGDEHKSGWYQSKLEETLKANGFSQYEFGVDLFLSRSHSRNRMSRPQDAHIYCLARKG